MQREKKMSDLSSRISPMLFSDKRTSTKKVPPEECVLVKILEEEMRNSITHELTELNGAQPKKFDIDACVAISIKKAYKQGLVKELMADYLKEKIADERKKFGTS